jgi:hypothetical protein
MPQRERERICQVYCVENEYALILRVVHGRRDLAALFGH